MLAAVALLGGCPTTVTCAVGERFEGGVCVSADAGPRDTGVGEDAPVTPDAPMDDAGPCGVCAATTPFCDTSMATPTCVECLSETDCDAPNLACVAGSCEACDGNEDCTTPGASSCDTTSHTCVSCTVDADCDHLTATTVCDTTGVAGVCVECNGDDESACGATVCDVAAMTCTDTPANSAGLCESCISDRQCNAGQVCVAMTWDDPATGAADPVAVGQYCLWRRDATEAGAPMGSCASNGRPYAATDMVTTVSGAAETVCTLAVSTCEALSDYRTTNCMTLDGAGDARCGVDARADGFCRALDAVTNRCTVQCTSDDDCRPGVTCNTGVSPPVCRL